MGGRERGKEGEIDREGGGERKRERERDAIHSLTTTLMCLLLRDELRGYSINGSIKTPGLLKKLR